MVHASLASPQPGSWLPPAGPATAPAAGEESALAARHWAGQRLIEALQLQPGERVLEIGCGHGELGAWVAERMGAAGRLVGIEPLPLRVVMAGRRHARFEVREGRAEDLSAFAPGSFDAVYLNGVFARLEQPSLALTQARRVLRPGGRIGLCSADAQRPHEARLLLREALRDEGLLRATPGTRRLVPVSGALLQRTLEDNALIHAGWHSHEVADRVGDARELMARGQDHGFGGLLSELEPAELKRVERRLDAALDARGGSGGLRLRRHFVVATACKPCFS